MHQIKLLTSQDINPQILVELNLLTRQLVPNNKDLDIEDLKLTCEKSKLWVAFDSTNKVIASVTLVELFSLEGHFGRVEDMIVDENHRGKGLGIALMQLLINKAQELNLQNLSLTSASHRQAAQAMYQKLGFVKSGSTDKFMLDL